MEEYLQKGIKAIIAEFPEIEDILDDYGIGCGPCAVGTCRLKDIVDIHDLPTEQERELMARIAKTIYPGTLVEVPKRLKKAKTITQPSRLSPPMRMLMDEHVLIKRWVALIPKVAATLDLDSPEGLQRIRSGIDFIRFYADRFHHAKEEEVLFQYFDENSDILKGMYADHTRARTQATSMMQNLDDKDGEAMSEHLFAYGEILSEHIKKEDEILYPWMDRNLSTTQVGEIFSRFNEIDKQMKDSSQKHASFIEALEKQLKSKGGNNETV